MSKNLQKTADATQKPVCAAVSLVVEFKCPLVGSYSDKMTNYSPDCKLSRESRGLMLHSTGLGKSYLRVSQ